LKKITFLDIFLTVFFILVILSVIYFQFISNANKFKILFVQTENEKYYYELNQKKIIKVNGILGITTILIENGKFRFIDSPCNSKICIHAGWVKIHDFPVICLPNKVSAYIKENNEKNEIDGMTR
jgi:hypothetical protein